MKTKIVATIGPASYNEATLREMILAGVNVARLNLSHGSHPEHREGIRRIRAAGEVTQKTVAIMLDTKGPEIRVKSLPAPIKVQVGADYFFTYSENRGEENDIPITYQKIAQNVGIGDRILVDDGNLSFVVLGIAPDGVVCRAETSGKISAKKGVNLPGREVDLPALTDKDKEDLLFGIREKVDFIAASFMRNAHHVVEIKDFLKENGGDIPVIAKIESQAGVDNLEEIIAVADGIMVARGDLGVEIPLAEVPLVQKKIIALCNRYGKPVITATQMLESMTENPRPTRAEVSDVANAILDGTDAVMLSGESAAGKYPLAAVKMMVEIGTAAERVLDEEKFLNQTLSFPSDVNAIGHAAAVLGKQRQAAALVIPTISGETPRMIARFRPKMKILATSPHKEICRRLALTWGVECFYQPYAEDYETGIQAALTIAKKKGALKKGDLAVLTAGSAVGFGAESHSLFTVVVD